jgi:hypothetical protein
VKQKTITSKVTVYFPSNEIPLFRVYYKGKKTDFNLSVIPDEKIVKINNLFLRSSAFNQYINVWFKTKEWTCEKSEKINFIDKCFVNGRRPNDLQLELESSANAILALPPYRLPYGRFNELIDVDKSNNFRTQLKAESVMQSLHEIQQDYMKCHYRTLLGYSSCEFSKITSSVPESERVDWTRLNQLESILKSIVPKFSVFKKNVIKEDKLRFNNMFNQLLNSPAYTVVRLSQDKKLSTQSFFTQLEAELESQGQGLSELGAKSEDLLEIDIEKLLNKEVYSGLKYYQELSK